MALSEKEVILYHHVRQDVINRHFYFHIENLLYHFRIPLVEARRGRREGTQVSDCKPDTPRKLHQFLLDEWY